ncbi:3112_t:CDS:2 [Cetraspora pellucida]|uniref:3112_t:CDS:1 n=1 Tax=Cetraspora pellucida TaxID=1433469 RepID=A0A9N9BP61_9GLOM|nr:3112_t:CDS:2 [Cetraspora pellucida]
MLCGRETLLQTRKHSHSLFVVCGLALKIAVQFHRRNLDIRDSFYLISY